MVPTIDELVVADPPEAWESAGFDVDADGVCRIGRVRVPLVGRERGRRILSWSLRDLDLADGTLDGIPTSASVAPAPEPAVHPNGTVGIDHVVVATPNIDRTTKALTAAGLDPRRTRDSHQYGPTLKQVFFRLGDVILEVIGAPDGDGDGPAGFFGLALTVADLEAAVARFAGHVGQVKEAVQPGRHIATLRHKELGLSVAVALMSTGEQEYQ